MNKQTNEQTKSRRFQFIHLEAYGLQANVQGGKNAKFNKEVKARTVSAVVGEALRVPGFCNHIQAPGVPGLLYGDLNNVEALCKHYHQNHKNTDKNGKAKALRSDANVLLAGVVSLEGTAENWEQWDQYKTEVLTYLKAKYGDNLKAVIEHLDEENPHLHYYLIPKIGQKLDDLHDGKKAVMLLKKEKPKALKGEQNKTYIEAMRAFQEDFYGKVSKAFGLAKIGPARSRASRKAYFEQVKLAREYKETIKQIEDNKKIVELENEKLKIEIEKARYELEKEKKKVLTKAEGTGFAQGMRDFNNNNYVSKIAISITYGKNTVLELKKKNKDLVFKHNNLIVKSKKILERKNFYKEQFLISDKKEKKLRKDFNERVNQRLEIVNNKNMELTQENEVLKNENENLKNENEQVKNDINLLNKIKKAIGHNNFNKFLNDLFKRQNPKNKI